MIFFTSDLHIGHSNILKLCDRPFNNITEHDNEIVKRHNEVVSNDDIIYDLGDLGFRCSAWYLTERLKQMNGKRIVILGNHDKPFRQAYKKGLLKDLIKSGKLEIVGGEGVINDRDMYISRLLKFGEQRVFVSHLACRTWPNAFRGCIHLYGHSHGNLSEPFYRSFDIGVDGNNYYPWDWDKIMAKINSIDDNFQED